MMKSNKFVFSFEEGENEYYTRVRYCNNGADCYAKEPEDFGGIKI